MSRYYLCRSGSGLAWPDPTHSESFLKYCCMSQWGKQLDWNISNEYHFELLAHSFHAYASADPITCFPIIVNPFQSVLPFYTFDMLSVFRIRTPESILLLSSSASCSSMVSFAILRLFNYTMFTLRMPSAFTRELHDLTKISHIFPMEHNPL